MTQPPSAALRRAAVLAGRTPMTREDWLLLATAEFSPGTAARLQAELEAHLDGAAAELAASGHPDPERAALMEMGDPEALRRELARTHLTAEEEAAAQERAWLARAAGWSDRTPWRRLAGGVADTFVALAVLALGFALYRWWEAGADTSAASAIPLAGAGLVLALALLMPRLAPAWPHSLRAIPALLCCLLLGVPLLAGGLWLVPLLALPAGAAALTALGRRSRLSAAVAGALGERLVSTPLLWAYAIALLGLLWWSDGELLHARFIGFFVGTVLFSLWALRPDLALARSILQKTLRPPHA